MSTLSVAYARYASDFDAVFRFIKNGKFQCRNEDHIEIRAFVLDYRGLASGYLVNVPDECLAFEDDADAEAATRNQMRMIVMYGAYYAIYRHSCEMTGQIPQLPPILRLGGAPRVEQSLMPPESYGP